MNVKLFFDHSSQPCRAVLTVAYLGNIKVEIIEKRIVRKDHISNDMVKTNPLKKLPFIIDEEYNLILSESHAIMKHLFLTRRDNFKIDLYPNNYLQCKIDEYLNWHHLNIRKTAIYVDFFISKEKYEEKSKIKAFYEMEKALTMLNDYFLKEEKFINGFDNITLADISCICELYQLRFIEFDFEKYKNIKAWMEKMKTIKELDESHKKLFKLADNFKIKNAKF